MKATARRRVAAGPAKRSVPALVAAVALAAGVGYPVHLLQAAAPKAALGDAANGKKLYAKLGCDACHKIGKQGGAVGPDLSREGTKRTATWLVAFLKQPQSKVPKAKMPPVKGAQKDLQDLAAYTLTLK